MPARMSHNQNPNRPTRNGTAEASWSPPTHMSRAASWAAMTPRPTQAAQRCRGPTRSDGSAAATRTRTWPILPGYLLKGAGRDEIVRAVVAVRQGEAVFGPGIAQRILTTLTGSQRATVPFPELTDRERDILDLVAHGLGNQAVAARLFLSEKTVRNTLSQILVKIHASDRASAILKAREQGLGGLERR